MGNLIILNALFFFFASYTLAYTLSHFSILKKLTKKNK